MLRRTLWPLYCSDFWRACKATNKLVKIVISDSKISVFASCSSWDTPASMATCLPKYILRHCIDKIVGEIDKILIWCQYTSMPIRLLWPDALVYSAGPLNSYAVWIAFVLEVGMTTFIKGI